MALRKLSASWIGRFQMFSKHSVSLLSRIDRRARMNRKYLACFTVLNMFLGLSLLHAQGGPPRGGIPFVGPDPQGNITFVNFQAGLGNKTVSGAPYCAQI